MLDTGRLKQRTGDKNTADELENHRFFLPLLAALLVAADEFLVLFVL